MPSKSSMNPNGFSMSNTVTPAQVATYYSPNSGGGTNITNGVNGGAAILGMKSSSELGDRTAQSNFRNVLIVITDAAGSQDNPPISPSNQPGCTYQNQANYDVLGVFCDPTNPNPPGAGQVILDGITCGQASKQFTIAANQTTGANSPDAVANDVTDVACGTAYQCECPPGFTLVYPDSNGNFTQSSGTCTPTAPPDIAPICRRVTCECPPALSAFGTVVETGVCDDFFLLGDPSYVNPTPKLCTIDTLVTTSPALSQSSFWRHNYRYT